MGNIRLIEPTLEYENDIWQFRQEILESDDMDKFAGCGNLEKCTSAREWIEAVSIISDEKRCPKDKVPSNYYIAVREDDNKIVGVIDLRHHINHPVLGTWGGHMGYIVRPNERKKGYSKEMLRLNLLNCRSLNIDKVLVTCLVDNIASEKTIIANGGIFEKTIEVDGSQFKRYWITV